MLNVDVNNFCLPDLDFDTVSEDDIDQLELLLLQAEAEKGLNDLFYFDKYILGYEDMAHKTHYPVCNFVSSPSRRIHLELPRGTFKSSVVTIGYTVQEVAKDPNIRILIDNEVYANSKAFLREVKSHMENPDVISLYPQLEPDKRINDGWTESTVIVKARTRQFKEPTISCAGLDQIKVGMHYDLIIMDDLVSDRNVTTREQIEKVINHYKMALSLLEPDGKVIVLGTRYNYADLYGYLLKNEANTFDHLIIPARIKAEQAAELNNKFPEVVSEYGFYSAGDLLFPERLTEEFLVSQRRAQGTYIYNCQYMLDPVDSETADFRREWIRYHRAHLETNPDDGSRLLVIEWTGDSSKQTIDAEYPIKKRVKLVITVDPNNKKKKTSDYTAGMVVAVTEQNDWYVLDMERDILNPGQIVKKITSLQDRYLPDLFGLEEVGKEAIQYMLKEEMRVTNKFFRITELKTKGVAKEDRIKRLVPRFEYGTIYLPTSMVKVNSYKVVTDLTEAFEDELMYFPVGAHDDLIDSLSYVEDLVDLIQRKNRSKQRKTGNSRSIAPSSKLPRNRRIPMVDRPVDEQNII